MWGIILALIAGALMSIQGVFNTEVTKQTSLWVSTGFVQLTAFFVCVIAWLCTGRENVALLTEVRPWYLLTGGILGAFINNSCSEYGITRPRSGCHYYCNFAGSSCISDRAVWLVWQQSGIIFMEENPWTFDCHCGNRVVSMGEGLK